MKLEVVMVKVIVDKDDDDEHGSMSKMKRS